ncbi:MAG: hypothetical protein ACYC9Y_16350 [Candidatus Methylomirabilia bacterium]
MPWVALPLLILLPGGVVLLCFGAARAAGASLWRAAAAGLLIVSWTALALAQLSLFSVGALTACVALGSLGVLALRRRRAAAVWSASRALPRTSAPTAAALALVALVLAAGALAARPGEYFGGGWDPGVYLSAGGSIAHRGGLITQDPLFASLDDRDKDLLFPTARTRGIKYPGFYVHDLAAGTLIPQFQPLYPALLAVAIGLFGNRAALYVNPAFAIASLLLLYHLAWVWRGRAFALAAAALLAFNVVQVWNSRFSTSEVTAQFLLLAGFVFLQDCLAGNDATAGALSGLAFGLAPMATVTTVLVLPFALAGALWPGGENNRGGRRAFAAALAVTLAHLVLWSVFVDPKYIAQVTRFFPDARLWLSAGVALLASVVWCAWSPRRRREFLATASGRAATTAALFLLALAWFWWGRALVGSATGAPALVKLSWFLTPWVLVPFALGGATLLAQGRRRAETAFLLAGLAMLLFFLYAPRMYPTYPFTLRRYTPLAIPVIAFAAAVLPAALLRASHGLLRAAGAAVLALALAVPLVKNRDLVRRTEYDGMEKLLADVDARLPHGGILLCEGRFLASALEHFGGRRVVILDRLEPERAAGIVEFVRRRLAAGEQVSLLTHAETPWSSDLVFEPLFTRRFVSSRREQDLKRYPSSVRTIDLEFTGYRVGLLDPAAGPGKFPARVEVGENALGLGPGFFAATALPGGGMARWTGTAAEITVPWPAGVSPVEVVLRLAGGERRGTPARVRLLLDGTAIAGETLVPEGMTEVRLQVSPAATSRPRRTLQLESTTGSPGGGNDREGRGVLLDWIEIRPLEPGAPQQ